jgi:ribonucleoside-diphosphate reductase alpha chain
VMGWAEALVLMGVPYDSAEALTRAGELMEFINRRAADASEALAIERGVFPNWRGSIYDSASPHFRGEARAFRHCARTTIAPTGTIGLAAGLQGAGIEPFYALAYTRYNAKALEAVKAGREPEPRDVYFEVNPLFRRVAEQHRFFGLGENELWEKIERNKKSVRGISEIPGDVQALFATCYDVSPEYHVRMQAAFQAHTDNAVSKTVNLPSGATVADVRRVFLLSHELGCKGITVYRDGSKQQQVLNLLPAGGRKRRAPDLTQGVQSEYYEIKTGHGPLHVHIDYDLDGPYRVFASLPPVGTEISGLTSIVGVLISKYLEQGGDPLNLLKHLQSVKGDRPLGLGEHKVNSISHAVAIALRNHLKKHGHLDGQDDGVTEAAVEPGIAKSPADDPALLELWNLSHVADQCPNCFSSNVTFGAGCSGPVCRDCGHSECS